MKIFVFGIVIQINCDYFDAWFKFYFQLNKKGYV